LENAKAQPFPDKFLQVPSTGPYLPIDLVDIKSLDTSVKYDLRYASTNNFLQTKFYDKGDKAYLQRPAAQALVKAHQLLRQHGYGIIVFDTYRPWYVTYVFWHCTPEHQRHFVANPERGSIHNRGCAADIGLFSIDTGNVVDMGAGYDECTDRSFSDYQGVSTLQKYYRYLLRNAMEMSGFSNYVWEWWHFDYKDSAMYPVCNNPV